MSQVYDTWFKKAMSLEPGEKLFLPVETGAEQKDVLRTLRRIQAAMSASLSEEAMSVDVYADVQDKKLWIVMHKRKVSRSVGYVKTLSGKLEKVSVSVDEGKRQRILSMISDQYSLADIEQIEGRLTDEELEFYSLERL